ncbi:MAG: biotin/lipoyl-binding protein [Desulfobacterales bacterium]|nr:biotin/lipoyl-binding protein [Desulfobacterales bacterium]
MKYNLEVNGQTMVFKVTAHEDHRMAVATDDREHQVAFHRIDERRLALVVDGVRVDAFVTGQGGAREILIDGVVYQVCDADLRDLAAAAGGGGDERPREVTPPMPSVVVKVLVEEGQHVTRGDSLVVVSAMKMETTLTAPFEGRIRRINVATGDKVKPGDILVDLEKVPEKAR